MDDSELKQILREQSELIGEIFEKSDISREEWFDFFQRKTNIIIREKLKKFKGMDKVSITIKTIDILIKLLNNVESALQSGGVDAAKEVCRNTNGPVASIFYQGLERSNEGVEMVEKSIVSYGSVQMGLLEKGLSWISLFIALAPMLGFMGTVIGMIGAFDAIEAAGDISPSLVAGGIKVALLTTVFGLIVAIILQIFYTYLILM